MQQGAQNLFPPPLWKGAPPTSTLVTAQSARTPRRGDFTEFEQAMDDMARRAETDRANFRRRSLFSKLQTSRKREKDAMPEKELGELSVQNSFGSTRAKNMFDMPKNTTGLQQVAGDQGAKKLKTKSMVKISMFAVGTEESLDKRASKIQEEFGKEQEQEQEQEQEVVIDLPNDDNLANFVEERSQDVMLQHVEIGTRIRAFLRGKWRLAQVINKSGINIRLHCIGESSQFDQWVSLKETPLQAVPLPVMKESHPINKLVRSIVEDGEVLKREMKAVRGIQRPRSQRSTPKNQNEEDMKHVESSNTELYENKMPVLQERDEFSPNNISNLPELPTSRQGSMTDLERNKPSSRVSSRPDSSSSLFANSSSNLSTPSETRRSHPFPPKFANVNRSSTSRLLSGRKSLHSAGRSQTQRRISVGNADTNQMQKTMLELATNASILASSILNCNYCKSPNVVLEKGNLVCRTCFKQIHLQDLPGAPDDWTSMSNVEKMGLLLSRAEAISERVGNLASILHRPTSEIAYHMVPGYHHSTLGGGKNWGSAFILPEEGSITVKNAQEMQGKEVPDLEKQLSQLSIRLSERQDNYHPSMLGYREEEFSVSSRASSAPSIAASLSEMSPSVVEHPSSMILGHGPADPRDLEASVRQYRVLLKTLEQVRYFEQLVITLQKDHTAAMEKQASEVQSARESLIKWCERQVEQAGKERDRSIRNAKAREIVRIMRIEQLSNQVNELKKEVEISRVECTRAQAQKEELAILRDALAKANAREENMSKLLQEVTRRAHAAERKLGDEKNRETARKKMSENAEEMQKSMMRQRVQVEANLEMEEKVALVKYEEEERRQLLLDTLLHVQSTSQPTTKIPTKLQRRDETVSAYIERLRQASVKLLDQIARQQEKGTRKLNEIIDMAKERVDELFAAQEQAAIERLRWLDNEEEEEEEEEMHEEKARRLVSRVEHGCQTMIIGYLEEDVRKFMSDSKDQKKSEKKGKSKDKKTKIQVAKSTDIKLSIDDIKNLHENMMHMFQAKKIADDERINSNKTLLPLSEVITCELISKCWIPKAAFEEEEKFREQVKTCAKNDNFCNFFGRCWELYDPLPQFFAQSFAELCQHERIRSKKISLASKYYRSLPTDIEESSREIRIIPRKEAVVFNQRLIEAMKLHAWAQESWIHFGGWELEKFLVFESQSRSKEDPSSETVFVCIEHVMTPTLMAWEKLGEELREKYRGWCEENLEKEGKNKIPFAVGHFADAMAAVLPPEIWSEITRSKYWIPSLFHKISSKKEVIIRQTERDLQDGVDDFEYKLREHSLIWMCGEAWSQVAQEIPGITLKPRPPSSREIGKPFGLTL